MLYIFVEMTILFLSQKQTSNKMNFINDFLVLDFF